MISWCFACGSQRVMVKENHVISLMENLCWLCHSASHHVEALLVKAAACLSSSPARAPTTLCAVLGVALSHHTLCR